MRLIMLLFNNTVSEDINKKERTDLNVNGLRSTLFHDFSDEIISIEDTNAIGLCYMLVELA